LKEGLTVALLGVPHGARVRRDSSDLLNNKKALFGEGFESGCVGRLQGVDIDVANVAHHIFHDLGIRGSSSPSA